MKQLLYALFCVFALHGSMALAMDDTDPQPPNEQVFAERAQAYVYSLAASCKENASKLCAAIFTNEDDPDDIAVDYGLLFMILGPFFRSP